jgi:hypothetical protein
MSEQSIRRTKITQGLAIAACLACAGVAVGDMIKRLRKHS